MMAVSSKKNLIALVAGMALPLAFSPFHLFPVAVISLALLFALWADADKKQALFQGFLFGFGMFGVGVSWIYVAIHDFGQADIVLAGLLTSLFIAFLAMYFVGLAWVIKKISPAKMSSSDILLLLPVCWLCYEWFKAWFLTGFPWLELGVGQIDGPLAGFIPVIGIRGVSLLTAFSAALIVVAWRQRTGWPCVALLVIWGSGAYLKDISWTQKVDQQVKVSLIQGNIPQEIKWDPKQIFKTLALYEARTQQHWDSDLIIWPENAVPVFYKQVKTLFFDPLARAARAHHTDILLGLPVTDQAGKGYFNAVMALSIRPAFYFKRHLVPFGEYVPFQWLRGVIQFFDLPMSAFKPGQNKQPLLHAATQTIGVSICYEDAFSSEILQALPDARLLVNVSNNAWYGDSFAPHQHLQISQSRALETGRPVLRSTTNGISAIIGFKGDIKQRSPQFKEFVLTGWVQPREGVTPYVRWGQTPVWLLSLFMLLIWDYSQWRNKSRVK